MIKALSTLNVVPTEVGADAIQAMRTYEPERYVAATLAPSDVRAALIAIAAYAADLSRIVATASQPMLGEIRLQWWRDSLQTSAQGERIGSPLVDALGTAIRAHDLPLPMLVAMSEARAWDLYDDVMPDRASLDGYLTKTEAIPFELVLRVLGVAPAQAGVLGVKAGRAFGMARLMAQLPAQIAKGRVMLPGIELTAAGIKVSDLHEIVHGEQIEAIVSRYACEVKRTLSDLRPLYTELTRRQRIGLLPLAVVSPYLSLIDRRRRDKGRDVSTLAPLRRMWRMTVSHIRGRI